MSVYFIQAEEGGPIKIGRAADPEKRLKELQTSHHSRLVIRHVLHGNDLLIEGRMHGRFLQHHIRGEWFRPHADLAGFCRAVHGDRDKLHAKDVANARRAGEESVASLIADVLASKGVLTLRELLHLASMLNAPASEVDRETFIALNAAKRAYLAAYSTWDVEARTQMLEYQLTRLRPRI